MGRRGNMRSRPGLLFIIVFAICLVVFYFSWRSMMAPEIKVKDTYTIQRQNLLEEGNKWKNKLGSLQRYGGDEHARDPNYDLDDSRWKGAKSQTFQKNLPSIERGKPLSFERGKPLSLERGKSDSSAISNQNVQPMKPAENLMKQNETVTKEFYRKPMDAIIGVVANMQRLVHLDLKGAAPKISYLKEFFPLIRKLGATGLLVEYEDMFPYQGSLLKNISAKNAYSMDDIRELLKLAKINNLIVMPLIQTFGHMEFVLKSSEFVYLRESEYTPQVIDITKNASYSLIREMVKQILEAHPDATHLHIGCDEVYELGKGASGQEMSRKKLTEEQLFLQHVQKVANIVREYRNVKPVMWDDELRKTPITDIENYKLPSLVEIMVWRYTANVSNVISNQVWDKYAQLFKSVWIASAFKGATGARQYFTEPRYHILNHFSWLDVIAENVNKLTFKGIALTGWQRYDHFATLCELLPVSVPSLAVCLTTMVNAGFTEKMHMATSETIQCSRMLEMTFPEINKISKTAVVTQDCRFPGHEIYHAMQELYGTVEGYPGIRDRLSGWLSDYQVTNKFTNPGQMKVLSNSLTKQSSAYSMVASPLRKNLVTVYSDDTVDEWMEENIVERQRRIKEQQIKIRTLLVSASWPQRPISNNVISSKNDLSVYDSQVGNAPGSRLDDNKNTGFDAQKQVNKFINTNGEISGKIHPAAPNIPFQLPQNRNNLVPENSSTKSDRMNVLEAAEMLRWKAGVNLANPGDGVKEVRYNPTFGKDRAIVRDWQQQQLQGDRQGSYNNGKLSDNKSDFKGQENRVEEQLKGNPFQRKQVEDRKDDVPPIRYRPAGVNNDQVLQLPNVRAQQGNLPADPKVDEDDMMRRKKYMDVDARIPPKRGERLEN